MLVLNGNNSLKQVATIGDRISSDIRVFEDSDYFLSNRFVDQYTGEVHRPSVVNKPPTYISDALCDSDGQEGIGDGCTADKWTAGTSFLWATWHPTRTPDFLPGQTKY